MSDFLSIGNIMQNSGSMSWNTDGSSELSSKLVSLKDASELKGSTKLLNDPDEIREVAEDFEKFFISYMLKEMRKTVPKSGILDGGFDRDMYTSMMDDAVADKVSQGSGIGLADILEAQLIKQAERAPDIK